jgi:hypothetical protein
MKIKEAKYKSVMRRTQVLVKEEVFGCDHCRKPITLGATANGKHRSYLQITIFKNGEESRRQEFCSWLCCLRGLEKVDTDYFVSLPYLIYDDPQEGIRAKDFFSAVRKYGDQ